ncbi:MAG TPA: AAA family ATPase [Rectinemataceae bacterium]
MKSRKIARFLAEIAEKPNGRLIVLTGARQTGKTTLARELFPEYSFLSIEDPVMRETYGKLTAAQWRALYPRAILDEVQKEPRLVESIKSVYDQWPEPRYLLSGSSQLLLMAKVKESLAGRCSIVDLFPLTLPELATDDWNEPVPDSFFQAIVISPRAAATIAEALLPSFLLDTDHPRKILAWEHYCRFGGYPALTRPDLGEEDRYRWLGDYVRTYLERDIRDLANFKDLEPFARLQRCVAQRTGQLLNSADISKDVGVSIRTTQKYIQYLSISYQVLLLEPWFRNPIKRLVKSPKLHFLDYGVLQAVLGKRGNPSGHEFESIVVAELYKQARTVLADTRFYHLRTVDGREIDLIAELPEGYFAFEIKASDRVGLSDARHLRDLEPVLDKPLLHSFVLSRDFETKNLGHRITAVHAGYFLGSMGAPRP